MEKADAACVVSSVCNNDALQHTMDNYLLTLRCITMCVYVIVSSKIIMCGKARTEKFKEGHTCMEKKVSQDNVLFFSPQIKQADL